MIFTARSGSTALYGNLKSHPQVFMRAEVFGNKFLPGEMEQTDDNRIKFLRRYWGHFKNGGQPPDGLSRGFKFQVTRTGEQFTAPMRFAKVANEYRPAVICLRRQNRLKQALSALNARRLREYSAMMKPGSSSAHVTAEDAGILKAFREESFKVNIEELRQLMKGIDRNYSYLDKIAERFEGRLDITYEDYASDRDSVVGRVMEHIGVDASAWEAGDTYLKITSDDLSSVIENYDDVVHFANENGISHML
ncbi:hypothetical protein EAT49_03640 [Histidinibacterium lentulum]|uniref:Sulphotransferase Stf0 domain-containing protein n=1 Tax=Histidinibacterium lentulum TaxID=2480588 RepID=A0A3N2R7Q5_9RHOB|nr:hypothetical protein EAT49_03640 [Histidinibacterium lentulum]